MDGWIESSQTAMRVVPAHFAYITVAVLIVNVLSTVIPASILQLRESPAYLSDAHLNKYLSPVFSALSVLSAVMMTLLSIFAYIVSRHRFKTMSLQTLQILFFPVRFTEVRHRCLCRTSLIMAFIANALIVVSIAFYAKLPPHYLLAAISAFFVIAWMFTLDLTLPWIPSSSSSSPSSSSSFSSTMSNSNDGSFPVMSPAQKAISLIMSTSIFSSLLSAILIIVFFPFSRSVISEYCFFASIVVFFLLLGYRLGTEHFYIGYFPHPNTSQAQITGI